jgi:glutamine cyclotransferase
MFRILFLLALSFFFVRCNNGDNSGSDNNTSAVTGTAPEPQSLSYSILNAFPHDTAAFTQGLEIYKGHLYESTGLLNRSSLRKTDLKSGKVLLTKAIDSPYFAEGITILRDTIYQLTWTNKVIFLYRAGDLAPLGKLNWNADGWGITNDGKNLYISDGSDKIYVVRAGDLKLQRVISVFDNSGPVNNLNELEFINGHIYANRWQYEYLLRINPSSGQVTARIDMKDILSKNSKADISYLSRAGSTGDQMGGVLNGIAWDSASGKMLVTGKLWPHIFEVKINE